MYDFDQPKIEASVFGYPIDRTDRIREEGGTFTYYYQWGHENQI
jgi:hypothetical protein